MTRTFLSLLVLSAAMACAQPIGFGVKGGVPLGDQFESENSTVDVDTKRYIVGPMVELRFPAGFAIELDALYTRTDFSSATGAAGSIITAPFDANSWEFPIMLKKKFGGANAVAASVRPFVGAGASFRRLSGLGNIGDFITGGNSDDVDKNNTGFVIGGGVEIRALFLKIAPEFRYTYWGSENFVQGLSNVFTTNKSQGQFLVGLYF